MTTPKQDVLTNFHTEFMSSSPLDPSLENQFLLKAIGDYELDLESLEYDKDAEVFQVDLKQFEVNALSMLMYKHYLKRELDRVLKLNNIVGKDIQLTSMGQTKQVVQKTYDEWVDEVGQYLNKIKDNSFYE
jgi:hypothetical protein